MGKFNREASVTIPEHLTLPLSPEVSMEFRLIPPGRFRMGSRYGNPREQPEHWVAITRPYYLGIYPVTQEQFTVWTKSVRIGHENGFPGNPHHPAENMNWKIARVYCEWLTRENQAHLPPGYLAGLPSEAEWEYACRAGTETEYYTGDGVAALSEAGWFDGNSGEKTHPVGEKLSNGFGLYDMHGNVLEWCRDAWNKLSYRKRLDGLRNPVVKAWENGLSEYDAFRTIRGGSWLFPAGWCRAASRFGEAPDDYDRFWGFRVCLFLGPCPVEPDSTEVESVHLPRDAAEVNLSEFRFPSRKNEK
ncbi:MAG: Sulphatase-modifying factor protein [Rubinisphaera sp.]|uniref:formylglycine-generating enzyme family protein n=2 Tax=Rubinisphaera TaxID=1649490 RepID=UPI000C118367|nr:formylglycine-generating enzyme family protein [Rubinisphaera sp.]MBV11154.1 Sulphatase-modifying factor protein [Rubinisphaera sp.]